MRRRLFWIPVFAVLVGCEPEERSAYVGGFRDPSAIPFRVHNRLPIDVVLKLYVRERFESVSLNDQHVLGRDGNPDHTASRSDLELDLFRFLPLKSENLGAYSIEVCTNESETRLGVIDMDKSEMDEAKAVGRATLVLREEGIELSLGLKQRRVGWIRDIPRPRVSKS